MNDKQSRDAMARQEKIVCAFFISILLVFMNAAYADCRSAWLRVINTSLAHTDDWRSLYWQRVYRSFSGEMVRKYWDLVTIAAENHA
jgi:hypothetical protein